MYPNRRDAAPAENGTLPGLANGMDKRHNGQPVADSESKASSVKDSEEVEEESCFEEESFASDYGDSLCEEEQEEVLLYGESGDECCIATHQKDTKPPPIVLDKDGDVVVVRQRKGAIDIGW